MERYDGLENLKGIERPTAVAVGVFDGVHRGHQEIIMTAIQAAREIKGQGVVLTFDPHPLEVLRPGSHSPILTSTDRKAQLVEELGADVFLVAEFTPEFAALAPDEFAGQVLAGALRAKRVVVGEDFRFGRRAAGDIGSLRSLGDKYGFRVICLPQIKVDGRPISSTRVRELLRQADVEGIRKVLGRYPQFSGRVVKGHHRGRGLGFPTANVETPEPASVPALGVYAAWVRVGGERLKSVVNIGISPTFDGDNEPVTHVHILDYRDSLYGREIEVEVRARLREEKQFESPAALADQIHSDIKVARGILNNDNLERSKN